MSDAVPPGIRYPLQLAVILLLFFLYKLLWRVFQRGRDFDLYNQTRGWATKEERESILENEERIKRERAMKFEKGPSHER